MEFSTAKRELLPDFAEHILEHHEVKFSRNGILSLDGIKLTIKEYPVWMLSYCQREDTSRFMPILTSAPSPMQSFDALRMQLRLGHKKVRESVFQGAGDIKPISYENLVPFISGKNAKKIYFYDKVTKKISDLDYNTYEKVTEKEFRVNPLPAMVLFNPYRPEPIYNDYSIELSQECTHINTYKRPDWQMDRALSGTEMAKYCKLPKIVDEFFQHLFPDSKCREFVLDWLHYALTSRCETYLVMNGAKGIGKNILSETICSALLGKNNHKVASLGIFDSSFNAQLAECRMLVFDEFKIIDDEDINRLKRFANPFQAIEYKGQDLGATIQTFNSYIISNNSLTDMKIAWDDRRFSVADITDKKLADVWSTEKIKELIDTFEDHSSEEVRNFGYWLLYREPKIMTTTHSCYKGDHFYKLCYTSMPEWAKMIIDEVTGGNPEPFYEDTALRMMMKDRTNGQQRFPNMSKVIDFLGNYKHNGQEYLGHVEKDERSFYIQVNPYFLNKKESTVITNDDDIL